jgi:hypothetical protein
MDKKQWIRLLLFIVFGACLLVPLTEDTSRSGMMNPIGMAVSIIGFFGLLVAGMVMLANYDRERKRKIAAGEIDEDRTIVVPGDLGVKEEAQGCLAGLGCVLVPIIYIGIALLVLWGLVALVKFFWSHS